MTLPAKTYLDPEEKAYPHGGFTRQGRAVLRRNPHNPIELPYGTTVRVRASIPDTFFTVPARYTPRGGTTIAGYLHSDDGVWAFQPHADPATCERCDSGKGCRTPAV